MKAQAITWTVTRHHRATLLVQVDGECGREATEQDLLEAGYVPIERLAAWEPVVRAACDTATYGWCGNACEGIDRAVRALPKAHWPDECMGDEA